MRKNISERIVSERQRFHNFFKKAEKYNSVNGISAHTAIDYSGLGLNDPAAQILNYEDVKEGGQRIFGANYIISSKGWKPDKTDYVKSLVRFLGNDNRKLRSQSPGIRILSTMVKEGYELRDSFDENDSEPFWVACDVSRVESKNRSRSINVFEVNTTMFYNPFNGALMIHNASIDQKTLDFYRLVDAVAGKTVFDMDYTLEKHL